MSCCNPKDWECRSITIRPPVDQKACGKDPQIALFADSPADIFARAALVGFKHVGVPAMNRFFTYTFAGKAVARPNKYMERIVLLIKEYVPNITEQEMHDALRSACSALAEIKPLVEAGSELADQVYDPSDKKEMPERDKSMKLNEAQKRKSGE